MTWSAGTAVDVPATNTNTGAPMLTSEQAATVARKHGLTLADAASLRALADDEATADRIAAQFAPRPAVDPDQAATRKIAETLFATNTTEA